MLTLNDGRNELWQWDTGRKLTVDADCSQVHFSNKVFGRSIDVDVIDSVAIIPDILLQTDKELTAWAFVGTPENGYTKISKVFKVNKRNKPADYVFTPLEQTTLEEIKEKLDYLESIQDPDAIKNAVNDYLEQNPVEAPVQSVNNQTGYVRLTAEDVGAISNDALQEATNEALAQAKASGEFDGKDGKDGADGYTPQKGVDYFDGKDGKDGQDGVDYVLTEADKAEIAEMAAELVDVPPGGGGIEVTGAAVGQTVKIAEVDENGRPLAWEAVDFPSGGAFTDKVLMDVTLEEEASEVRLNCDASSINECDYMYFLARLYKPENQTARGTFDFKAGDGNYGSYYGIAHNTGNPSSSCYYNYQDSVAIFKFYRNSYGIKEMFSVSRSISIKDDQYHSTTESEGTIERGARPAHHYPVAVANTSTVFGVGSRFIMIARTYNK